MRKLKMIKTPIKDLITEIAKDMARCIFAKEKAYEKDKKIRKEWGAEEW